MTMTDSAAASTLSPRLIYPQPQSVQWGKEFHLIADEARLELSASVPPSIERWMIDLWQRSTLNRIPLQIKRNSTWPTLGWALPAGQIDWTLPSLTDQATYAITVDARGAAGAASGQASLRHSWSTLVQLLEIRQASCESVSVAMPFVKIQDRPGMTFRGLHLCVFPETSRAFLEKVIHAAGLLKYSHLVFEFWGTLKLDTLPELSWPQAWTKTQAKELFALAESWGMQVVPMYNIWGHAASCRNRWGRHVILDQNPLLAPLFEPDGWTWCLSHPQVPGLIRRIMDELCDLAENQAGTKEEEGGMESGERGGRGGWFHLGCDEAYSHATCDRCRHKDRVGLWADHVNSMAEHLRSKGRRSIMWSDALLQRSAWPDGFEANGIAELPTHTAIDRIDRRIVIADWHYDVFKGPIKSVEHFRTYGYDVLVSPWHELKNIRTLAEAGYADGAMGMLATTWHRLPQHMPMIPAAADACWSRESLANHHPYYWSLLAGHLATHLRRLCPSEGDFAKAGWHPFEQSAQE